MAIVRVVVVDEDGNPQKGATVVAYSLANFPNIIARQDTDRAGSVLMSVTEAAFFDAFDRRGVSFRDRAYQGRIQIQIVSFGSLMNVDYVVDPNGFGTHTTLDGASGAWAAVVASPSGADRTIWICGGTTLTNTLSLTGLDSQHVIIAGPGASYDNARVRLTGAAGKDIFIDTPSVSCSILFQGLRIFVDSGFGLVAGSNTMQGLTVETRDCFLDMTGAAFTTNRNGVNANSGHWVVTRCGGALKSFYQYNSGSGNGQRGDVSIRSSVLTCQVFWEWDSGAVGFKTTPNTFAVDASKITVTATQSLNNMLGPLQITDSILQYNVASALFSGDMDANGTMTLLDMENVLFQTTTARAALIDAVGNVDNLFFMNVRGYSTVSQAGVAFITLPSGAIVSLGNVFAPAWSIAYSGPTPSGGSLGDHGTLSGLLDDDHSQYVLRSGRNSPLGNTFGGYASWGTAASGSAYPSAVIAFVPGAYWRMDESSGNLTDSSGNGNTATANGGLTYSQPGALFGNSNTAILFNGTTGYFSRADTATVDPANTLTLLAWIKYTSTGANQCIMSKGAGAFYFGVVGTSNKLVLGKSGSPDIVTSTIALDANYHFVAATKSGTTTHLYIDGVDVTGIVSDQTLVTNASALNIGRDPNGSTRFFNGVMDEVAILPTALSAANIATLETDATTAPAPINTGDADVTVGRLFVTNAALDSEARLAQIIDVYTPGAGAFNTFFVKTTPSPGVGLAADEQRAAKFSLKVHPTANYVGSVSGFYAEADHNSGAFNVAGMQGFFAQAIQGVAGTTVTALRGARVGYSTALGTTSTAFGLEIFRGLSTDAGTLGTGIGIRIGASDTVIPGTSDIALQSLGGENRFVGALTIGADAVPAASHVADVRGDVVLDNEASFNWRDSGATIRTGLWLGSDDETNFAVMGGAGKHFRILTQSLATVLWSIDNSGNFITIGTRTATPSTQQSIAVSAPIVANAEVVQISTTTAANMTATPTIADGADGQILVVLNTGANTFTLQDQGTLGGSNLRLVTAGVALGTRDSVQLMYSAATGDWVQIAPVTNVI